MGQKYWAIACAFVLALVAVSTLTAQQANTPFADVPSTSPGEQSEPGRPGPGDQTASSHESARQRIEGALDQPLRESFDFVEQPLRDVMTIISETYDIPIQFDAAALDPIAASPDMEVSINIANVSLRTALDLMLRNAGAEELTYIIDKEVLLITTQEEAETRLEVKVYRVDDLIGNGAAPSPYGADADALIDLIVASVEHDSWQENGTGEGEIKPFPPGMIVISQTHRVQEQVQALLDDLRRNKAAVESAAAESTAQAPNRPVSRSIDIDVTLLADEGADNRIREALMKSVDWSPADADLPEDDKFLTVMRNRVLVRHLPHVVAQVQRSVRDLDLSPRRSRGGGGGRGGRGDSSGGGTF